MEEGAQILKNFRQFIKTWDFITAEYMKETQVPTF